MGKRERETASDRQAGGQKVANFHQHRVDDVFRFRPEGDACNCKSSMLPVKLEAIHEHAMGRGKCKVEECHGVKFRQSGQG